MLSLPFCKHTEICSFFPYSNLEKLYFRFIGDFFMFIGDSLFPTKKTLPRKEELESKSINQANHIAARNAVFHYRLRIISLEKIAVDGIDAKAAFLV